MAYIVSCNVQSGTPICLNDIDVQYNVSALLAVNAETGKSTTATWNNRLAKGDYNGFENPRITVAGLIDTMNLSYDGGVNPDSSSVLHITGSMLHGLIAYPNKLIFYDERIIPNLSTPGSVYCFVDKYNISRSPTSELTGSVRGYILDYTLNLVEVQK